MKPRAGTGIGLVKNKTPRTIELAAETVALLRAHRAHQAEIKDGEPHDRSRALGNPLQMGTLGRREFGRLLRAAGAQAHQVPWGSGAPARRSCSRSACRPRSSSSVSGT